MAQYGNFNGNNRSKGKKITVVAIIAAAIIVVIYIIGIFAGGERAERVSSAVAENVRLKEQISEMSERIAFLEQENEELNARIAFMPTPAPATEAPQETLQPTPSQNTLPRGGR